MTRARMQCILVAAARCNSRARLAGWYEEVYGAAPGDGIPTERLRESVVNVLREAFDAVPV